MRYPYGCPFRFAKLISGDSELPENLVIERRTDLLFAVHWNGNGASVGMNPSFVASGLAAPLEAEARGSASELLGTRARQG